MVTLLIFVFLVLLFIGVPIAMGIGIAAWIVILLKGTFPSTIIAHKMANGVNSFPLIAVPLYILTGLLAGETGIASRLVRLADTLVGHIRGGLGHVNVVAAMFFGGISGSAVADAAAIGALMIPQMEKHGYSREDAGAITACSSTLGILIPPSIPMVLYGVTMGISIGALFIAGILPGILIGFCQMGAVYVLAKKKKWPQREKHASLKEVWIAFKEAFLALLLPVFLLGAIITGITTATEAGVLGVLYALFLGGVVYKEYRLSQLYDILLNSAIFTAVPCFVVATTSVSAWVIAIEKFPEALVGFIYALSPTPFVILLLINLFLIIVGMFMDLVPALILFAPILYPVVIKAGVTPIQFGAILTVNLGIGLVTPPVGNCLYTAAVLAKADLPKMIKAVLPFLIMNFIGLMLITYIPWISTWLPSLFFK
jgi:tripartite ATP-independent transporter DctM subunit